MEELVLYMSGPQCLVGNSLIVVGCSSSQETWERTRSSEGSRSPPCITHGLWGLRTVPPQKVREKTGLGVFFVATVEFFSEMVESSVVQGQRN